MTAIERAINRMDDLRMEWHKQRKSHERTVTILHCIDILREEAEAENKTQFIVCKRCGVDMAGSHSPKAINGCCLSCCNNFPKECEELLLLIEGEADENEPREK